MINNNIQNNGNHVFLGNSFQDKLRKGWYDFRYLLKRKPIEMIAIALIGTSAVVNLSYKDQSANNRAIPLAFSEREDAEAKARANFEELPALTVFYTGINDMPMKVFEDWNGSWIISRGKSNHHAFAELLQRRMDPDKQKYKYEIHDFVEKLPKDAIAVKKELSDFISALSDVYPVAQSLDQAWDENHNDIYRTEWYYETVTETDSEGNTTSHEELRSKEVYDYTIHTYTFHDSEGHESANKLTWFTVKYPKLEPDEKMTPVSETHDPNERAIQSSRERQLKGKILTKEEMVAIANLWYTGSTFAANMPIIQSSLSKLQEVAPVWNRAVRTAQSDQYNTGSSFDAGPMEFQISENALGHSRRLYANLNEIIDGINYAQVNCPEFDTAIKDYIGMVLEGKPGDKDKQQDKIMDLAKEMYKRNFKNGVDVTPAKWYMVAVWGMIGLIGSLALGYGVDQLGKNTKIYGKDLPDNPEYGGYYHY